MQGRQEMGGVGTIPMWLLAVRVPSVYRQFRTLESRLGDNARDPEAAYGIYSIPRCPALQVLPLQGVFYRRRPRPELCPIVL